MPLTIKGPSGISDPVFREGECHKSPSEVLKIPLKSSKTADFD
jgi:hypothetical protein